jgi:hypothetical protein
MDSPLLYNQSYDGFGNLEGNKVTNISSDIKNEKLV